MRQVWNVARHEFRSYFDHATAYILVVAFLALALFFTFRSLYGTAEASLRGTFSLLPWLLAVFVPAITMRAFAEERRSGTLEWLLAQPISELQVLGGKFLGNWLFVLAVLAGTVPTAAGVLLLTDADAGVMAAQYLGTAMLAMLLVGIGLFASAATSNQITAFILALAINFVLLIAGLTVATIGLPPAATDLVSRLAILGHLEGINRGVLDLRDLLYFLTTGALFFCLTYLLLVRERLSLARSGYVRLRVGVAVLGVGVVLLNLLGDRIHGRLDLTADNLYTLSSGTRQVIEELDDMVTIKLVVSRELPQEVGLTVRDIRDLLADYRRIGHGKVRVTELNPDRDEQAAQQADELGIPPLQFNVMRGDEFQARRGWLALAVIYAGQSQILGLDDRTDDLEYRLTSTISVLAEESKPNATFLTGFGAYTPEELQELYIILDDRYNLSIIDIEKADEVDLYLEYDGVLIFASPGYPVDDAALTLIRDYLDAGGSALLAVNAAGFHSDLHVVTRVETGLAPLLERYGIKLGIGTVFDLRSRASIRQPGISDVVTPYPYWPNVRPATEHMTTRGLTHLSLGWTSPLDIEDSPSITPLWQTTEMGGRQLPGQPLSPDLPPEPAPAALGRQVVAAAVEWDREVDNAGQVQREPGRLVVIGDGLFLRQDFVRNNEQNVIFAANAVDWLAQDDALVTIRSKSRTPPPLVFESDFQKAALKWGNLIGVPLIFVGLGLVRVMNRRRFRGQRWEENA